MFGSQRGIVIEIGDRWIKLAADPGRIVSFDLGEPAPEDVVVGSWVRVSGGGFTGLYEITERFTVFA